MLPKWPVQDLTHLMKDSHFQIFHHPSQKSCKVKSILELETRTTLEAKSSNRLNESPKTFSLTLATPLEWPTRIQISSNNSKCVLFKWFSLRLGGNPFSCSEQPSLWSNPKCLTPLLKEDKNTQKKDYLFNNQSPWLRKTKHLLQLPQAHSLQLFYLISIFKISDYKTDPYK